MKSKSQKPRKKLSGWFITVCLIFAIFTVMNFTSMNALAADYYWTGGHTISGTEWYESDTITMQDGDLTIQNGGELRFNDSVTFEIICDYAGQYGIIIESGGKFIIDSPSANTEIVSDPANQNYTYSFTNSGTIDFL